MPETLATAWIGVWGRPPDRPAQVALAVGAILVVAALVPGGPRALASALDFASLGDLARRRRFLTLAGFAAAFLSLGYVAFYLRGGPRAGEAAAYWLQGRALSHGDLAWSAPGPTASFRTRWIALSPPDRLAGVLPPGYPLLLAVAFLVGAPMLAGPLLAAAIVVASWKLTREMALGAGADDGRAEAIGRVAAGLSIASAALRYHTAEALPHGAVALGIAMTLAWALQARRTGRARTFGAAGLALGFVVAAQPSSAIAIGAIALAMATGAPRRARAIGWTLGAASAGVLLLASAHRAAVGRALLLPQSPLAAWNAASVVDLLHGLRAHLADIANLEPLALLVLVPAFAARSRGASLALLVVAGHLAIGAERAAHDATGSFADVLPLEHALVALALSHLFPRLASAAVGTIGLALVGFAVHTSHDHARLAAADPGRPPFEPDVLREANVTHGLVFFDTDEGFELASDPAAAASHGVQAARLRGDDRDRLLYDSLGHPAIHRYTAAASGASVSFWSPPGSGSDPWRFEAEADWPPALLSGGRSETIEALPCAADGRALVLEATSPEARATIELAVPRGPTPADKRAWIVTPRVLQRGSAGQASMQLVAQPGGEPLARWTWSDASPKPVCTELGAQTVDLGGPRAWLELGVRGGSAAVDRTMVQAK